MIRNRFRLGGRFYWWHKRNGIIIAQGSEHNLVVDQGLNYALNAALDAGSQIATWYVGIFESDYTPLAGDTGTNFPTDAVECTAYDEATRPIYVVPASTAQSITNVASRAEYTFNASKTIYGAFLISSATKGATGGTMFAAGQFDTERVVASSDQLLVGYVINAT